VVVHWLKRARDHVDQRPAGEIYAGPGWATLLAARKAAEERAECRLYIMSAGFGLLEASERIPPYSATFAPGADQVSRRITGHGSVVERHQTWWRLINTARGRGYYPLTEALREAEQCVVAVGVNYLLAASRDFEELTRARDPEQLVLICVGAGNSAVRDTLRPYLLPFDLRTESFLPGPRTTINARAARWLLSQVVPRVGWCRHDLEEAVVSALANRPRARAGRQHSDDDTIIRWIRERLSQDPQSSKTALLRHHRQSGLACEQARFARLVERARREEPPATPP